MEPSVKAMHRNKKDGTVVAVEIEAAITNHDASFVKALAQSIRTNLKETQWEHRSFGEGKGGNDCTYLSPFLQALQPNIANQVRSTVRLAYQAAGWNELEECPDPFSLGIRTSEHLSYQGWKSLEAHKDVGSVYTCMMALAEPTDYVGGEFFVHTSFFEQTDIQPTRLQAIVFLSDTTHGVRPITAGCRESFVTELWKNDDAPRGMNRPTPEEWDEFLAQRS